MFSVSQQEESKATAGSIQLVPLDSRLRGSMGVNSGQQEARETMNATARRASGEDMTAAGLACEGILPVL